MLIGITGSGGGQMRIALKLALTFIAKSNVNTLIQTPLAREERPLSTSKLQNQNRRCRWWTRRLRRETQVNPNTGIVPIESITPLDTDWRKRRWMVVDGKRVAYYTR